MDKEKHNSGNYAPFTPKLMLQLAAPHTWCAAILPVLLASAHASIYLARQGAAGLAALKPSMLFILLAISVLFQSSVNTINDYFDFKKGTDTVENQDDPSDAVLVYNRVNPRAVLAFFVLLVVLAFALGAYCISASGIAVLFIALIGLAVVLLYSGGKTPISYLPIGEAVSGLTMGYLIALASSLCLVNSSPFSVAHDLPLASPLGFLAFFGEVFVLALPVVASIALIMLTNNTCDIEKDRRARRSTLPVLLGHEKSRLLYRLLVIASFAFACIGVLWAAFPAWPLLLFSPLLLIPLLKALFANPLLPETRAAAFAQCISLDIALNSLYILALFAGGVFVP